MKTSQDFEKGDRIVYMNYDGKKEYGVVSSINDMYVFVKYDNDAMVMETGDEPFTSMATPTHMLRKIPQ